MGTGAPASHTPTSDVASAGSRAPDSVPPLSTGTPQTLAPTACSTAAALGYPGSSIHAGSPGLSTRRAVRSSPSSAPETISTCSADASHAARCVQVFCDRFAQRTVSQRFSARQKLRGRAPQTPRRYLRPQRGREKVKRRLVRAERPHGLRGKRPKRLQAFRIGGERNTPVRQAAFLTQSAGHAATARAGLCSRTFPTRSGLPHSPLISTAQRP